MSVLYQCPNGNCCPFPLHNSGLPVLAPNPPLLCLIWLSTIQNSLSSTPSPFSPLHTWSNKWHLKTRGSNKQMVAEQGPGSISRNLDQLEDESATQIRGKYTTGTARQPLPRELDVLGDKSRALASSPVSFLRMYTGGQQTFTQRLATQPLPWQNRLCWDSVNCPSAWGDGWMPAKKCHKKPQSCCN